MRVQDKVVVVTGGANCIGRARAVSLWPLTSIQEAARRVEVDRRLKRTERGGGTFLMDDAIHPTRSPKP